MPPRRPQGSTVCPQISPSSPQVPFLAISGARTHINHSATSWQRPPASTMQRMMRTSHGWLPATMFRRRCSGRPVDGYVPTSCHGSTTWRRRSTPVRSTTRWPTMRMVNESSPIRCRAWEEPALSTSARIATIGRTRPSIPRTAAPMREGKGGQTTMSEFHPAVLPAACSA
jgi:hypothetical protein